MTLDSLDPPETPLRDRVRPRAAALDAVTDGRRVRRTWKALVAHTGTAGPEVSSLR